MLQPNRAQLVSELEEHFGKRVFLIVYNYLSEPPKGFIEEGDEFYFRQFRDEVLKKESISDCIVIINGPGGNVKAAIACSEILRKSLIRYDCFVPTVASSSLCYFILNSNRVLIGERSVITQIDPLFYHQGQELRAVEHLNDSNQEIRRLAHDVFNPTLDNLNRILKNKPHVFEEEVSKQSKHQTRYLGKMVDTWMKKTEHDAPLTIKDLQRLKVRFRQVDEEIIFKAKNIINECLKELIEIDKRFVIQTSKIEEERYFGGYYY